MKLKHIKYKDLNSRQKESYNFAKVSALLADYGVTCVRMHDDYNTGDFMAVSADGQMRVQLKSRPTIAKGYQGKELMMAFPIKNEWYLIKHDDLVVIMEQTSRGSPLKTENWIAKGTYHQTGSKGLIESLKPFKL